MLDADALTKGRRRAAVEMAERHRAFDHEVGRILCDVQRRGVLHSSATGNAIATAVSHEYETRAKILWQLLQRTIDLPTLLDDANLASQLKGLLAEWLDAGSQDLAAAEERVPDSVRSVLRGWSPVSCRSTALTKVNSEIDIVLLETRRAARSSGSAPTVNIFQPSGIVQTGQGATVTSINLGPTDRERFAQALDALGSALGGSHELSDQRVAQVQELAADIRAEVSKPSPSPLRLQGALATLATTIQTMGSTAAAYQLLKAAAASVGLPLP